MMNRFSPVPSPDRARPAPARAWDKVFLRFAAIKRFPEGLTVARTGQKLFAAWERWLTAPHPAFLRPATIDFSLGWMVREWIEGFTLVDLLRHRRKLSGRECFRLLQTLPPILDHAHTHGMLSEIDLDKIYVQFPRNEGRSPEDFLAASIDQWPLWGIRVEPLRLTRYVPRSENFTDCDRYPHLAGDLSPAQVLHRILREMGGGAIGRASSPLAAFGDPVNRLLARPPETKDYPTATAFFRDLVEADPTAPALPPPAELRSWQVYTRPPEFAREGTPGDLLFLEPLSGKSRAIRLVAHEELRIGRSTELADVTVLFPGRDEESIERTKCLGRVHARLRRTSSGISICDGTEAAPSRHGTYVSAGQVSHGAGTPVLGLSGVQFGPHWRGTLMPVVLPRQTLVGEEPAPGRSPAHDWGALFIWPWPGSSVLVESVWLLEEAGFAFETDSGLVWDTEALEAAPLAFRREGGSFVLVNQKDSALDLKVDGKSVPVGSGVSLRDGQGLQIESAQWRMHIC